MVWVPAFGSPGVVQDQHRTWVAQLVNNVPPYVVVHLVCVPHCHAQQALYSVRRAFSGLLGQLPT